MRKPKTLILILLSLVLLLNTGMGRARTAYVSDISYDESGNVIVTIPVRVTVNGAAPDTPSPGDAVFHFNIWPEDPSMPLTILSNAVWTNGFGTFYGNLVFSVPESYERLIVTTPIYVQQYDGNPDWVFDTSLQTFYYGNIYYYRVEDPLSPDSQTVDYAAVTNVYRRAPAPQPVPEPPAPTAPVEPSIPEPPAPVEPTPVNTDGVTALPVTITREAQGTRIELPVYIGVEKYRSDAPPAAVFTFGLYGMDKEQKYEWEKDTVTVPGEGLHAGSISFTVPDEEALAMLKRTGFDVRERTAVVPGWSFAAEVYHISLTDTDEGLTAKIERRRGDRLLTTPSDAMYFLNYYGMDRGTPHELPASPTGVKDLMKEIRELDGVIIKDTLHVSDSEGRWEISFEALKQGHEIGNCALSMSYAKAGGEYSSLSMSDVLRIKDQCVYIKLESIAEAYTELSGKEFLCGDAVPEGEWAAFTNETISWLDLPALDLLMRSLIQSAGEAFDEFTTVRGGNGYSMSGSRTQFDQFELKAIETAGRRHADWYALSRNAALSEDMKSFAASYESAFTEFTSQALSDEEKLFLLREQFPKVVNQFSLSLEQLGREVYQSRLFLQYVNDEGVVKDIDNIFVTESAASDDIALAAPDSFVSGDPYLYALIMRYALPDRRPAERPDPSGIPDPDSSKNPDTSGTDNSGSDSYIIEKDDGKIIEYLACTLKLNPSFKPKNGKYYTEGEPVGIWVTIRNRSEVTNTSVYFYDSDDAFIYYDPHYYPKQLKSGPWFIEQLEPGTSWSFMYYHEITAEECEKGEYTFRMHAESAEGLFSNYPELGVVTGGIVETKNPLLKPIPEFILTESSQPSHKRDQHEYYIPGETIRYKVTVKNDTDEAFYDFSIGILSDERPVIWEIPELLPGKEEFFIFEQEALPTDKRIDQKCYIWATFAHANGGYTYTSPQGVVVTVAPE